MSTVSGKRYWLVGASAGIGRELALCLARQGAALAVSSRDGAALGTLVEEMAAARTDSGGHVSVRLDLADGAATRAAFEKVGEVDGVIYCAGAYEPMSSRRPDLDALETMVDVNLMGALRVLSVCVPALLNRGSGRIVLVGSLAGYVGLPGGWGYGATKAALIHLAENLRCDLRGSGVTVQVCNPGFVATRLTDKNRFAMPFIMTAEAAADRIVRGMARNRFEIAFPFVMAAGLKILAALPRPIYFALVALSGARRRSAP